MNVIILFISGILALGVIAVVAWAIRTYVKDSYKIKNLLQNGVNVKRTEDSKVEKQEEYKPSQEEIIRSIVKEEIEQMGSKIIRSIPQPTSISQRAIVGTLNGIY